MPEYQDEAGKTRWTRIVYVIELSHDACADRKSPCDGACGKTPVYVGQTAKSAEDRFAEHKTDHKSSMWVKRYGVRGRPDLSGEYGEMGTEARVSVRPDNTGATDRREHLHRTPRPRPTWPPLPTVVSRAARLCRDRSRDDGARSVERSDRLRRDHRARPEWHDDGQLGGLLKPEWPVGAISLRAPRERRVTRGIFQNNLRSGNWVFNARCRRPPRSRRSKREYLVRNILLYSSHFVLFGHRVCSVTHQNRSQRRNSIGL